MNGYIAINKTANPRYKRGKKVLSPPNKRCKKEVDT